MGSANFNHWHLCTKRSVPSTVSFEGRTTWFNFLSNVIPFCCFMKQYIHSITYVVHIVLYLFIQWFFDFFLVSDYSGRAGPARRAASRSRPASWWCGLRTACTTSSASPAARVTYNWCPATATRWSTAASCARTTTANSSRQRRTTGWRPGTRRDSDPATG